MDLILASLITPFLLVLIGSRKIQRHVDGASDTPICGKWLAFIECRDIDNQGIELEVGYKLSVDKVNLSFLANASYVKNEVADLAGDDFVLTANYSDLGGPLQIMKPGYPMGSFYVYQWKGFVIKAPIFIRKQMVV